MKFTFIQIKNLIDTLDSRSDKTEEGITKKIDLRKLPSIQEKKKINGQKVSELSLGDRMRRSNKYNNMVSKTENKDSRDSKFKEMMAENFQN